MRFPGLWTDLRHSVRANLARPRFSLLIISAMALGIGVTVGAFSFLSYFARPTIDAPGSARLAWVHAVTAGGSAPGTSLADWLDLEAGTGDVFESLAGWQLFGASIQGPSQTRLAWGHAVSGQYFQLFGAEPQLGRLLLPTDDRPGAEPVLVLSHLTWTSLFEADPAIVGTKVRLNGTVLCTVIGVARAGFQGEGIWTGIYVPLSSAQSLVSPGREVVALGRVRSTVTLEQADQRLTLVASSLDRLRPLENRPRQLRLVEASSFNLAIADDPLYTASRVLMVAVGLLLALACANVANLMLARSMERRRELAVHAALGAGRLRIARRLAFESIQLSLAGGACGLLLASGFTRLIESFLRRETPVSMGDWGAGTSLTQDEGRVALFFVGVSVLSGLLFGLAPMLQAVRVDLMSALRGGGSAPRRQRARFVLVVAQVALSVVLLVAASLLGRTLVAVQGWKLGFDDQGLLLATIHVPRERLRAAGNERLQEELVARVRRLGGVDSASLVSNPPMSFLFTTPVEMAGVRGEINTNVVGEGYFETLGLRLLEGRPPGPTDLPGSPRVVVVNRAAAERYWPGRSALGERVRWFEAGFEGPGEVHEVVGVVADSRYEPTQREIRPLAYLPLAQHPRSRMTLLVRARGALAGPLHDLLRDAYPDLAVVSVASFGEQLRWAHAFQSMNAEFSLGLALLGLLLAALGVFSVLSYTVTQQTREIGIRLAIGAAGADIRRWVLRTAARPVLWGIVVGIAAAWAASGLLRRLLVGVEHRDPVSFAVVPLVLIFAAFVAAWLPARRASRVEPSVALRDS